MTLVQQITFLTFPLALGFVCQANLSKIRYCYENN